MKKIEPSYKTFIAWCMGIFMVIVPYITYLRLELLPEKAAMLFPNTGGYAVDFFLYYKEIAVIVFAVFLLLFFAGEHIFPDHVVKNVPVLQKQARYWLIPAVLYAVCIILSMLRGCIRGNIREAFLGSYTEYEGGLALLSYLVLFLASYNYFSKEKYLRIFYICLDIFIVSAGILGAVEYFYKPFYEFDFLKYVIAPEQYRSVAESLNNENFRGQAALALYNPGYLGGLSALLFPLAMGQVLTEKNKKKKVLLAVLPVICLFLLVISNSTGAMYATVCSIILFLLFWKAEDCKEKYYSFGMVFLSGILAFGLMGVLSQGKLFRTLEKTFFHQETASKTEKFEVQNLTLKDGELLIEGKEGSYIVCCEDEDGRDILQNFSVVQEGEKELLLSVNEKKNRASLETEDGSLGFEIEENVLFIDFGYDSEVGFYISEDGLALAGLNGQRLEKIPTSSMKHLERFYSVATGRGYIWLNTLPLLKECLLIGTGSGSFAYMFPQNQVVELLKVHGSSYFLVDKPHDWYLQVAVSTGVISLIVLLVWIILYIRRFVPLIRQKKQSREIALALPFLIAVIAFCITGFVNDSMITVNPVFWMVFGIGASLLEGCKET